MKRVVMWSSVLLLCLVLLSGCSKNNEGSSSNVSDGSDSSLSSASVSETPVKVKAAVVKDASSGLRVRATASSEGDVLAVVNNGDTFRLLSETLEGDDWYKISYNGTTAYLNQEFVDIKEIDEDEMSALESSAAAANSSSSSSSSNSSSSSGSSDSSSSSGSSESSASSSSESSDSEINTPDKQDVEN